ncbi:hypothetical protein [Sandarakinorhabdus sp.]|uniref:hypothetical protein n=1 Tax=Sandarakinorhabdus sp. TaxID=1916663 RepID=UPI00286DB29B|nr:hypothetical protein [Sandarakinorhabdus sp.]
MRFFLLGLALITAHPAAAIRARDVGIASGPLFVAVADATEEAIINSLLMASGVSSRDPATGEARSVPALDAGLVKRFLGGR